MNFHVLTLFPDMVSGGLNTSILGRAAAGGHISLETVNIRDFTENKHKKVDDYPYGGGAGMLMQAQPVYDAYRSVEEKILDKGGKKPRVIYVTPQGRVLISRWRRNWLWRTNWSFCAVTMKGLMKGFLKPLSRIMFP